MAKIKYRAEIDGLRALAVLSVIIYHADFNFFGKSIFSGGFFGVDVFFVISGYLITAIINEEFKTTEGFSFLNFYNRRIRRLVPALIVIFIVCSIFAFYLLLPDSLINFSKSVIWSSAFMSNFYWYESLQIYGADSTNLNPLLHSWSLAVEEQFYILFPLIFVTLLKFSRYISIAFILSVCIISFLYSEFKSLQDPLFSFYLLPSRLWELLVGASLIFIEKKISKLNIVSFFNFLMTFLGLILLFYAFINFELNEITHPGKTTLFPVIGTALIILFTNKNHLLVSVLCSKSLVKIGLISYSLYLWHFPIFSFLTIMGLFDLTWVKLVAVFMSFFLSIITYKIIEQPFRSSHLIPIKRFYKLLAIFIFTLLSINILTLKKNGFPSRFNESIALGFKEMKLYRQEYWDKTDSYMDVNNFSPDNYSVTVIGNSWAKDIANALVESSDFEINFDGMTGHRCKAITLNSLNPQNKFFHHAEERCLKKNVMRFKTQLPHTDLVIIADNKWLLKINDKEIIDEVNKNIGYLREFGYQGPVMIISNRPTYTKSVFEIIKDFGSVNEGINHQAQKYLKYSVEELKIQDKHAKSFYTKNQIIYYSLVDTLCKKVCKIIDGQSPLYYDKEHLTLTGAKYIGSELVDFIQKNVGD